MNDNKQHTVSVEDLLTRWEKIIYSFPRSYRLYKIWRNFKTRYEVFFPNASLEFLLEHGDCFCSRRKALQFAAKESKRHAQVVQVSDHKDGSYVKVEFVPTKY